MNKSKNNKESLRKEFQDFADSIIWSNDDGSEKYIGIGNMFDWWWNKFSQALKEQRLELEEKIEKSKYVFDRPKEDYLPEVYKHLKSKNEAKDDILSLIRNKEEE